MRFIAVIDIGKTNAKVAIVDSSDWRETAIRTIPNNVLRDGPYPHFDVETIWHFIIKSMAELNVKFPIDAISITTHGACGVLLDADGCLAMPVLDYEFAGPDELAKEYDLVRPDFSETGSPRLKKGLNLGAQIYWQMARFPQHAKRVDKILTYAQYWAYRLTGIAANEVTSLGCHTDLWNPFAGEFSSLVVDQGWLDLMATVRNSEDVLGPIQSSFAKQTGLQTNVPVTCGIHDSNASLYPHLISHEAPFSVVSSGTWTISMAVGCDKTMPDQSRDTLVNVNAFGEAVPSARFMGGREFDILMEGRGSDFTDLDRATIIKNNTMISPCVESDFGPFQGREKQWHGVLPKTDGEHYVAVSFYLALMTATCLELIGANGPTLIEGPFAKNELYLDMLRAATKRDVIESSASATGTSIGAARLVHSGEINNTHHSHSSTRKIEFANDSPLEAYVHEWNAIVFSS